MHYTRADVANRAGASGGVRRAARGPDGIPSVHFELAVESLRAWAQEQGSRMSVLPSSPRTSACAPPISRPDRQRGECPDDYCDFAVPFA